MIETKPTERGFARGEFEDRYGSKCSIQESSLATEDCIWLGVNDANPKVMGSGGWEPIDIEKMLGVPVFLTTRMHLTRERVRELLPLLRHFADTGRLPRDEAWRGHRLGPDRRMGGRLTEEIERMVIAFYWAKGMKIRAVPEGLFARVVAARMRALLAGKEPELDADKAALKAVGRTG